MSRDPACRNVYIRHGSISRLSSLVLEKKIKKAQKNNNLRNRLFFLFFSKSISSFYHDEANVVHRVR